MTIEITVVRPGGETEVVLRDDLPRSLALSAKLQAEMKKQTRAAGRGEVQSIRWIEPEVDAETLAWERIQDAYGVWDQAFESRFDDPSGQGFAREQSAKAALDAARAAYREAYGETGAHAVAAREAREARQAEIKSGFIARGLD